MSKARRRAYRCAPGAGSFTGLADLARAFVARGHEIVSQLLGALYGAVALRAVGPYFLIITLALGYLPWALAIRWRSLTGGG
jgi:ABC-type branched-subunit amino acid transport system permease subunit